MQHHSEISIEHAIEGDYEEIIEVWELSVLATHHFLDENYRKRIRFMLPSILPVVNLFIVRNELGKISGFLGVSEDKIEMLFIHPDVRGTGIGRALTDFAIHKLFKLKVDVNEQNDQAIGFYQRMGFVPIGRTDTDGLGKPYPIIQMELKKT